MAEKRTALEIAADKPLCFSGPLRLEFDLNFISYNQIYFGYILRIVNGNQNIDLIYDPNSAIFRVTSGQNFSGISFSCDQHRLYNEWNKLAFLIDLQRQQISLLLNDKPVGASQFAFKGNCFKFLWGANDDERFQTRDIPPMRLKDIRIFNKDELQHHWSLNEVAGTACVDEIHQQTAVVKNGVWLKPRHQQWELVSSFILEGNAVAAFDQRRERLLITAADSVITYEAKNRQRPWSRRGTRHENVLIGSQAIYDTITDQLYNIFIDQKEIAAYTPESGQWNTAFADTVLTEYWHANKFISPRDTSLYVVGGYGQLRYKNKILRYGLMSKKWETITARGDFLPPRYLAGMGMNATGDTAYLVGGYGSMTGDQMLDPRHYYDLFAFDIQSGIFKKLFELDSSHSRFTFANNLVIDSKARCYYGLVFSKDSFNSKLQLLQGSLQQPGYRLLGSSIPYSFYDVQSFADLYYAPDAGKLIAVTLLYANEETPHKTTMVKVYTIDFPPVADGADGAQSVRGGNAAGKVLLAVLVVCLGAAVILYRSKVRKKQPAITPAAAPSLPVQQHSTAAGMPVVATPTPLPEVPATAEDKSKAPALPAMLLFGQFQVLDKEGEDVTELFTPLIKELFLLIVIYTVRTGRGITSDELNEILWNNKPAKDAKNNRAVNMTKLKSILERVGHCVINKKAAFWQFQYVPEEFYLDYDRFVSLVKDKPAVQREFIEALLQIVEKGAFLYQTEYNWLDDIKAEISNTVLDHCLDYLKTWKGGVEDAEFVIRIANAVFFFDRLNEEALECKCKSLVALKRHSLASNTYAKFVKDYKDIYNEEFYKSFNEVIKTN